MGSRNRVSDGPPPGISWLGAAYKLFREGVGQSPEPGAVLTVYRVRSQHSVASIISFVIHFYENGSVYMIFLIFKI